MFRNLRIRQKLLLAILGSTVVTLAVSGVFLERATSRLLKTQVYSNVHSLALAEAARVETELRDMVGTSTLLRAFFENADKIPAPNRRAVLYATMRQVQADAPNLVATWTTWEKNALDGLDRQYVGRDGSNEIGRFVATWYGSGDAVRPQVSGESEIATADWYLVPKETGKPAILDPSFYSYTGDDKDQIFETSYVVPLFGPGHRYLGAVGTDLALSRFWDLLGSFRPFDQGYAVLIDNKGTVIFHPTKDLIGKPFASTSDNAQAWQASTGLDAAIGQGRELGTLKPASEGHPAEWFQFVPVPVPGTDTPWSLGVAIPKAVVETGVDQIQGVFLAVGLALATVLTLLVIAVSRILTVPLGRLNRNLAEIASGEGDLTRELAVRSRDELGQLSGHFNRFLDYLNGLMVQIQGVITRNQDVSATLASSITQSAAAVEQITRNVEAAETRTQRMDAEVVDAERELSSVKGFMAELQRAIEEQKALVSQSSRSAGAMAETLGGSWSTSQAMRQQSEGLMDAAEAGKRELNETQAAVGKIGAATKVIADMLSIINNITDQTNLLAMNAAIEAAHAGSAGRGFSVVAQEIRKLAEETSRNAHQISSSLKDVLASIDLALKFSANTRQEFDKLRQGIEVMAMKLADNQTAMAGLQAEGQQISAQLAGLHQSSERLGDAGRQAQVEIDRTAERLVHLTALSREARLGAAEDAAGLREIQANLTTIRSSSSENHEQVARINQLVHRFKVKPIAEDRRALEEAELQELEEAVEPAEGTATA